MIWYRAWLEARPRLLWCLPLLLPLVVTQFSGPAFVRRAMENPQRYIESRFLISGVPVAPGAPGFGEAAWINIYLLTSALICLGMAAMMPGTGVCTQTATGLRQGGHASLYFTLSLPVRRRHWLLARASLGALLLLIPVTGALAIPPLTSQWTNIPFTFSQAAVYWPFFVAGSYFVYFASVLFGTWLDEMWQGFASLGVVGFFAGTLGARKLNSISVVYLMCGGDYMRSGNLPWMGLAVCVAIIASLVAVSVYATDRREY